MTLALPDPPTSLRGPARAFYAELREMLAVVAPTQVHDSRSSVRFDDAAVELELAHAERSAWCIWATVGDRDAIAGTSWAHEHFFPSRGTPDDREWTTQIVDFIAERAWPAPGVEAEAHGDRTRLVLVRQDHELPLRGR